MYTLTTSLYKDLLDCHLANLYSFYFKLFKYEQYVKKNTGKDISSLVDDTIDIVNHAIEIGEQVYHDNNDIPELSMDFLVERSKINHQIDVFVKAPVNLLIEQDRTLIEQTLSLIIYCSDSMNMVKEKRELFRTQIEISNMFNDLQLVLQ